MQLPMYLQLKVNKLYSELNKKELTSTQKSLTEKYKQNSGKSESLIKSNKDGVLYAISRMPATYSVIYTLISNLLKQGFLDNIKSAIDVGSGTGAGYFALKEIDETLEIKLVEKDNIMIETFKKLTDEKVDLSKLDIIKDEFNFDADLILSSYVLSEMTESDRMLVLKKLLNSTKKYLLLIDTGTPKTYEDYMKLKLVAREMAYSVTAPCNQEVCALKNDYCQFYARVERSSLHRIAKSGELPYEDEKYFYLLFEKSHPQKSGKRVIRRPIISTNEVKLKFCTENGVEEKTFTKHNKEEFKKAKKIKINEMF